MKVTKETAVKVFKIKLSTNPGWAIRGLMKIYEYQTLDEQANEVTCHQNDVGFTGADAEVLSSFAKFYSRTGFLTDKQMKLLHKKMPKYARQLLSVTEATNVDYRSTDIHKTIAKSQMNLL